MDLQKYIIAIYFRDSYAYNVNRSRRGASTTTTLVVYVHVHTQHTHIYNTPTIPKKIGIKKFKKVKNKGN